MCRPAATALDAAATAAPWGTDDAFDPEELAAYARSDEVADLYDAANLCTDKAVWAARTAPRVPAADQPMRGRLLSLFAKLMRGARGAEHLFHEQWVQCCWLFDKAYASLGEEGRAAPVEVFATAVFSLSEKLQHGQGCNATGVYGWIYQSLHRQKAERPEAMRDAIVAMELDILKVMDYAVPPTNAYSSMAMLFLRVGILSRGRYEGPVETAWQLAGQHLFRLGARTECDFPLVLGVVAVGLLQCGLLSPQDVPSLTPEEHTSLVGQAEGRPVRAAGPGGHARDCLAFAALASRAEIDAAVHRVAAALAILEQLQR